MSSIGTGGPNTNTFYGSINRFVDRTASTTVALIPGPRQSLWITGLQNPANPSDAVPYSYITGGSGSSYFANSTITNLNVTSDTVSSMYVTNETVAAMNVSTVSGTVSLTDANATIRTVSSNNYYYVQKMTGAAGSLMGATCLSQNGLVLAVGASDYNSDIGAIYVYTRRSITLPFSLSQTLTVTPVSSPGNFGQSVSVSSDGTTIIGGAPNDNGSIGATYVFFNPGYSNSVPTFMWSQQAYLVGTGYIGNGEQGWQCDLSQDGNTLVTGAPYDNSKGAAWVFTRSGSTWTQQQKLIPTNFTGTNNYAGFAVSLSVGTSATNSTGAQNPIIIIGGYGDNSSRGAAWVFTNISGTWTQTQKLTDNGYNTGNSWFGSYTMTSYDGSVLIVGASRDNSSAGAIYAFSKTGSQTTYSGPTIYKMSLPASSDLFGASLGLDRFAYQTMVVGVPGYSAGSNIGEVIIFTNAYGSAAPLLSNANWVQGFFVEPSDHIGASAIGSFCTMDEYQNMAFGGLLDNSSAGAAWLYTTYGSLSLDANVDISGNLTGRGTINIAGSGTIGSLAVVSSAIVGTTLGVSGIISSGNGKAFYYNNATQSIINSQSTTVLFPNNYFNTFGSNLTYSGGTFTNNSGTTMYLIVTYSFRYYNLSGTGAGINGYISLNGFSNSYFGQYLGDVGSSAVDLCCTGSSIIQLTSGSTFQIDTYQNTGGTVSIGGTGSYQVSSCTFYQLP